MNEKPPLHPALTISGASCQGCVRKIRSALEPLTGSTDRIELNLDEQTVALPDGINTREAARIVTEAGYPASPLEPSSVDRAAAGKEDRHPAPHQDHSESVPRPEHGRGGADDIGDQIHLAVTGATCASCVSTIEKALVSVKGITGAHMNLADNTATATGQADTQALIKAVESAGYGASLIEDPDAADDRKQEEDRKQYKTLLVKMAISLSLGLGLMVWGMGFGSMVVTSDNQLTWLTLGIATLGVMTATGGHFFTGAWKAFRHHNANMDTLIALGTGTAWMYSMTVASIPEALPEMARHVYFEASAMIIGLINLGQALELRAKGKTS